MNYHQRINNRAWKMRRIEKTERRAKKPSHEKLASDVEKFLASGGEIEEVPGFVQQSAKPKASWNW